MRVRAVTLDVVGTLLTVAEPVGVTYARVAARHGVVLDPAGVERRFRAAFATAPPLALPTMGAGDRARRERAWWRDVVAQALGPTVGQVTLDTCAAELFASFAEPAAWRVFPDVPAALAALRHLGIRLGVVSNFDGRLPTLLARLELASLLDVILYSTSVGHAKPDPAIFLHALSALCAEPAGTVHVGDDPDADIAGAHAAGLRAILLARGERAAATPPDVAVIRSLAALPSLVG